jgi:hypothetical protein
VLHSFSKNGVDGYDPLATLTLDAAGNLYGTTLVGGAFQTCPDVSDGCGTVFELSPNTGGGWREKVLHSFSHDGQDGYYSYGGVIVDAAGNLYGTTSTGGPASNSVYGSGTVFELRPLTSGVWGEKILYGFNFSSGGTDGAYPNAGVVFGPFGSLYGTTVFGGLSGQGTVFEVTP